MNLTHHSQPFVIKKIPVLNNDLICNALPRIDYSDAFLVEYIDSSNIAIETVAELFFNSSPVWARKLLIIRNALVGWMGLKTRLIAKDKERVSNLVIGQKIGLFRLFNRTESALLFGENDKHLDVRMILKKADQAITITTLIQFNNIWGKCYFKIVRIFHQQIMKSQLKKVIRQLNIKKQM
ncbi:DUF2867 domain-containing protein [Legionella sainthelensi]|uniref:DUF2867 domain-containing protein n=1 Tax=Legionella sainthelensi TaxID=28087 RepID=UPI001FD3CC8B|nr:DUF2867 domain-containing protein [Legionella sainthelensi]